MDTPVIQPPTATQPDLKPIRTGSEYIDSLRDRKLKVYLFGELVDGAGRPSDDPALHQRGGGHLRPGGTQSGAGDGALAAHRRAR